MLREATQISHYRLLHWIDGGGMGDVYLAENMHLNTQVAIKVIKPTIISNSDARRLFLREAKAAATLDHPYILPLFDYGEATIDGDIYPYMVMPLRLEGSLKTWLKQFGGAGKLPQLAVAEMIGQAASALQHAHDRQIIHLDVKPSNFLLRFTTGKLETPDLLLTDFGLAKITNTEVSMSNTSRGTPSYMAPEQWRGFPVAATDQYALATMAYEMLTGRTPFLGKSLEELMYQHLHTPPEPPSTFNPALPKEIDEVLLHALAKNPEDRFASIAAFANAFRQALRREESQSTRVLRTTLTISQYEARSGTSRSLDLPGVQRINVTIPAGVRNGQVIRLSVQGKAAEGTTPNAVDTLMITIAIAPDTVQTPEPLTPVSPSPRTWMLVAMALLVVLGTVLYLLWRPLPPDFPQGPSATPTTQTTITPNITNTATTTTVAMQSLYNEATSGKPVLNDPLVNNSLGHQWDEIPVVTQGGTCAFIDGAYHVTQNQSNAFYRCAARNTVYGNFAYQVEMVIQAGDEGGIIFRFDRALVTFYSFHISTDAAYRLDVDNQQGFVKTLSSGTSSAIKIGHNRTILLTVIAQGTHITLFVNKQYVTSVIDATYSRGSIGVMAQDDFSPTNVAFTNAKVWLLPS